MSQGLGSGLHLSSLPFQSEQYINSGNVPLTLNVPLTKTTAKLKDPWYTHQETILKMHSVWTYITILAVLGAQVNAKGYGGRSPEPGRPCGFKIAPCPEDMTCVPNSDDCKDTNTCAGTCQFTNKYPPCGSRGPVGYCDEKTETCGDDPRTPGRCGMKCDAPGICIPNDAPPCNGFAGFQCPDGLFC